MNKDNNDNIILKKIDTNHFSIKLELINKNNLDISKLINTNLFKLIGTINKDVIERVEIINNISENEADLLYVFKRFGKELGLSQKYMYIKSLLLREKNNFYIKNYSIPYNSQIGFDCIKNDFGYLKIEEKENNVYEVSYEFKMTIEEDLPSYMENIIGNLMKNIFINFKTFIEKTYNNINE
tara:strand:- start:3170 stop:3715 length:546 start_codon:yes stop_codon:yes gene_type:complete